MAVTVAVLTGESSKCVFCLLALGVRHPVLIFVLLLIEMSCVIGLTIQGASHVSKHKCKWFLLQNEGDASLYPRLPLN